MKTFFIKVPCAFVLGSIVALGLMQNDPWLKRRIERLMISSVTSVVGELLHVQVTEIDLLRGILALEDVALSSSQGAWSLYAPIMRMHISWLSWFKGNGFATDVVFERPTLTTSYANGVFAAEEPFYALLNAPLTIPITIRRCTSQGSHLTIRSEQGEVTVACSSKTVVDPNNAHTKVWTTDGKAYLGDTLFAQQLSGTTLLTVPHEDKPYSLTMKLSCTRPEDIPYQLYYRSTQNRGNCRFRAEDGTCSVQADGITFTPEKTCGDITFTGDLKELATFVTSNKKTQDVNGQGTFEGTFCLKEQGYEYEGTAHVEHLETGGMFIPSASLEVKGSDTHVKAKVVDAQSSGMTVRGSLSAQFIPGTFSGNIALAQPYNGFALCPLKKGKAQFSYDKGALKATFDVEGLLNEKKSLPCKGTLRTDFKKVDVTGTCSGNPVSFTAALDPFTLQHLKVSDQLKNQRLTLLPSEDKKGLTGTVDGALIKRVFELLTGQTLTGSVEAQIAMQPTQKGTRIDLKVEDATLKIPGTYTVIKELSGMIDLLSDERTVIINDLNVTLHKGSAWSSRATFRFSQDGSLESAHIPLQCKGLLLSKHKELFGTLSGGITVTYAHGRWRCEGLMTIENAQLRSNLLSSEVQRELMSSMSSSSFMNDIDLAVRIQTHTPLKVQTSFLTTDAHLEVLVGGTAHRPTLSGEIELANGILDFPYKPLFVTSGTLLLTPSAPDGPAINLTAKNKVRAYNITMRVTGSLSEPTITFESSPQLSEESIITLLFAGSDQGSLSAAMPRVLMQQIEDVLFGSDEQLSQAQQFIKNLLTPLKNVRLIKKDTDQEELQAVLEVDINDRLRAKAQNNLQLSDETQLELEYVVSDDVTVKAVRDQTGSLGGEVEMRWKF